MHVRFAAVLFLIALLAACGPGSMDGQQSPRLLAGTVSTTASSYNSVVQQLYVAYFGRPADTISGWRAKYVARCPARRIPATPLRYRCFTISVNSR